MNGDRLIRKAQCSRKAWTRLVILDVRQWKLGFCRAAFSSRYHVTLYSKITTVFFPT